MNNIVCDLSLYCVYCHDGGRASFRLGGLETWTVAAHPVPVKWAEVRP